MFSGFVQYGSVVMRIVSIAALLVCQIRVDGICSLYSCDLLCYYFGFAMFELFVFVCCLWFSCALGFWVVCSGVCSLSCLLVSGGLLFAWLTRLLCLLAFD